MPVPAKAAGVVLQAFRPILELDRLFCEDVGRTVPIPTFDSEIIMEVCKGAEQIFQRTDIVIELHSPFYVVGDIHGNIFDLVRIFIHARPPPRSRFLFLGDYVDRGEYSVEVVTLLFAMVIAYPDHVFLLRGNHEFETMNAMYGFSSEIAAQYPCGPLFDVFNAAFQWLPLVAILDDAIFCVHGGIAPLAKTVAQLRRIKRPLVSYETEFVADLVWSDPCSDCKTCDESARGLGVQFGVKPLQEFLATLKMRLMLRAHQCVQSGIGRFEQDLLYTIFSCSRYEGQANRCGLLFVDANLQVDFFSLPPLEQIPRSEAMLQRFAMEAAEHEMQLSDSLAFNTKLFDVGQPRMPAARSLPHGGKKESLLQKFARMGASGTERMALVPRLPKTLGQRGAGMESPKQLPVLVAGDRKPSDS
jgi:protein phosphatase